LLHVVASGKGSCLIRRVQSHRDCCKPRSKRPAIASAAMGALLASRGRSRMPAACRQTCLHVGGSHLECKSKVCDLDITYCQSLVSFCMLPAHCSFARHQSSRDGCHISPKFQPALSSAPQRTYQQPRIAHNLTAATQSAKYFIAKTDCRYLRGYLRGYCRTHNVTLTQVAMDVTHPAILDQALRQISYAQTTAQKSILVQF
jgi:hypothetical protein